MTSSYSSSRSRRSGGFTLVEVLIAASLGTIVMAGVLSAFLMLVRSGVRVANYSVMESQTRRAFEQLGIDSRMANYLESDISGGTLVSFTLTIPLNDLSDQRTVTYGYDTSDPTDKKFFMVPGDSASATVGRVNLITKISNLTFLRYDSKGILIPTSTVSDAGIKHIQVSISVSRADSGVAAATQIIRSSAFTLRNITL